MPGKERRQWGYDIKAGMVIMVQGTKGVFAACHPWAKANAGWLNNAKFT